MSSSRESSVKRGAFIVLEGIDHCGKTTQSNLLLKRLESANVASIPMRFPDRTTAIGSLINQYLTRETNFDDRTIHLLFSANRWEKIEDIERHLFDQKQTIVCDRYAHSGVAFTTAKSITGQKNLLNLEWCQHSDTGLPAPDVVIFLDISVKDAEQRQK